MRAGLNRTRPADDDADALDTVTTGILRRETFLSGTVFPSASGRKFPAPRARTGARSGWPGGTNGGYQAAERDQGGIRRREPPSATHRQRRRRRAGRRDGPAPAAAGP